MGFYMIPIYLRVDKNFNYNFYTTDIGKGIPSSN